MIRDTELETGLQELAAPLVKAAGFAPNGIEFRIIIDSDYNAFVAGKMAVYIHSGLLLDAKSPEEILGVIAHELGHIRRVMCHVGMKPYVMPATPAHWRLAAIALAAGGAPSDAVVGVAVGGNDRARRSMLQSFRYDEAVADELGLEYLEKGDHISWPGANDAAAGKPTFPSRKSSVYITKHILMQHSALRSSGSR